MRLLLLLLLTTTILTAPAQWAPGFYIDSAGNKVEGLLKYTYGGSIFSNKSKGDCRLHYKANYDAKASVFTSQDVQSFVIGADSFGVVHDFRLDAVFKYPQDFAHLLETGAVKLFQYDALIPRGRLGLARVHYYILEKDNKGHLLSSGNFRKTIEECMADDAELLEKVGNKEYKYKHIQEVVESYNRFRARRS